MSAPQALIEFFQKEATEYLDRLDQLLAGDETHTPDAAAFLSHARALRGSSAMTRLEGLSDLASTVERIANGLHAGELRWDQRLHFAVRGALVELRSLVNRAGTWGDGERRHSRTQSVALAAVAAGYLATATPPTSPSSQVIPISKFFPEDGSPAILQRNPAPPITIGQRFRGDIAAAADGVAREAHALVTSPPGPSQLALSDGLRRGLLGLSDVAESYGAASISGLATKMARAPLSASAERTAVQSLARLLMDRELTDQEMAGRVKNANLAWSGAPAAEQQQIVPIESLLYRGRSALVRARDVRDELKVHWNRGSLAEPTAHALFEELSDLLDLAVTT